MFSSTVGLYSSSILSPPKCMEIITTNYNIIKPLSCLNIDLQYNLLECRFKVDPPFIYVFGRSSSDVGL